MVNDKTKTARGRKRPQVANACIACRSSKVKCSGKHPTCSRCRGRGLDCVYDVSEEGMTKRQHMRNELSEQRQELEHALCVLRVLQMGTDEEAAQSLARLRLGHSIEQEYQFLQSQSQSEDADAEGESVATTPTSPSTEHTGFSRSMSKDNISNPSSGPQDNLPAMPTLQTSTSESEMAQHSQHLVDQQRATKGGARYGFAEHRGSGLVHGRSTLAGHRSTSSHNRQLAYLAPNYEGRNPAQSQENGAYDRGPVPQQWSPSTTATSPSSMRVQQDQIPRPNMMSSWPPNHPMAWDSKPFDPHNIDPSLLSHA